MRICPSLRVTSGKAARTVRQTPSKSTSTILSNSASSQLAIVEAPSRHEIPALAKAISRCPKCFIVFWTTSFVATASVTSSANGKTRDASN